jgi:organic radical activating enzyme
MKIYLDSNSTLPGHLQETINLIDIVAADLKLPSSTGDKPYWDEHREFLEIARAKSCFVKVVVTNETRIDEMKKAVEIVADVDNNMLLVLQPAWPIRDVARTKNKILFDLLFESEKKLKNVRIMPQMHKVIGVK